MYKDSDEKKFKFSIFHFLIPLIINVPLIIFLSHLMHSVTNVILQIILSIGLVFLVIMFIILSSHIVDKYLDKKEKIDEKDGSYYRIF